jgi:hypothetical protein
LWWLLLLLLLLLIVQVEPVMAMAMAVVVLVADPLALGTQEPTHAEVAAVAVVDARLHRRSRLLLPRPTLHHHRLRP